MGYEETPLRTPKLFPVLVLQTLSHSGFWLPAERFIRAARCAHTEGSVQPPCRPRASPFQRSAHHHFSSNKAEENPNLGGNKGERGTSRGGEGSGAKPGGSCRGRGAAGGGSAQTIPEPKQTKEGVAAARELQPRRAAGSARKEQSLSRGENTHKKNPPVCLSSPARLTPRRPGLRERLQALPAPELGREPSPRGGTASSGARSTPHTPQRLPAGRSGASAALTAGSAAGLRGAGRRTWGRSGEAAAGSGSGGGSPRPSPSAARLGRGQAGGGAVTAARRTPADRGLRAPPPPPPRGQPEAAARCSPRGDGRVP